MIQGGVSFKRLITADETNTFSFTVSQSFKENKSNLTSVYVYLSALSQIPSVTSLESSIPPEALFPPAVQGFMHLHLGGTWKNMIKLRHLNFSVTEFPKSCVSLKLHLFPDWIRFTCHSCQYVSYVTALGICLRTEYKPARHYSNVCKNEEDCIYKGIWCTFGVIDHWNIMTRKLCPVRFGVLYLIAF